MPFLTPSFSLSVTLTHARLVDDLVIVLLLARGGSRNVSALLVIESLFGVVDPGEMVVLFVVATA